MAGLGKTALAIHGIEPANLERCRDLRAWLGDRGVERVTLFVVPAPASRPFPGRVPGILRWLDARVEAGDCIAQLGFLGGQAEWDRLGEVEATERLECGKRLLSLGGYAVRGFASAEHAWTPALRRAARTSFDWNADRTRLLGGRDWIARALRPASPNGCGRLAGRAGTLAARELLRFDVHPDDDRLGELERLILSDREFLTYDQLDAPARERQQAVAEVAGRRSAATAFARARAPG